ncbi:MAG: ABC transporter ATP-binding protein, partial [Bacilli bacterium]|nr:ABC transporter ATP-binding protein [Bacilli bacterium]
MKAYPTIDYPSVTGSENSGKEAVLQVRDLSISFKTDEGRLHAVRGVSFDLFKEETLCIVGESGSGKSVTNKSIMGILPKNAHIDSGSILYEGEDLTKVSEDEFHRLRGTKIGMIFQDPLSSLNPIMKIGKQMTEVMIIQGNHLKKYYDELINKEFIAYKNDQRLLQLEKEELKRAKAVTKDEVKALKKAKAEAALIEAKLAELKQKEEASLAKQSELKERLAVDLEALKKAKAEAKIKVKAKKDDIDARHKANLKEIFAKKEGEKKSASELYRLFILEHRRYLSEIRVTHKEAKERALKIMAEVGIPEPRRRFNQYPFEFSGGMRQRIVIAIALTEEPDVLICDEPTTALDVTIQAQILELINRLKATHHMSVIFITHDLGVVANMADRVAVMYAGKIVEYGTAEDVFYAPAHPYTWALLSSIPDIDSKEKLEAIPGTPPNLLFPPVGDAFAPRSKYALAVDYKAEPPM